MRHRLGRFLDKIGTGYQFAARNRMIGVGMYPGDAPGPDQPDANLITHRDLAFHRDLNSLVGLVGLIGRQDHFECLQPVMSVWHRLAVIADSIYEIGDQIAITDVAAFFADPIEVGSPVKWRMRTRHFELRTLLIVEFDFAFGSSPCASIRASHRPIPFAGVPVTFDGYD